MFDRIGAWGGISDSDFVRIDGLVVVLASNMPGIVEIVFSGFYDIKNYFWYSIKNYFWSNRFSYCSTYAAPLSDPARPYMLKSFPAKADCAATYA
jgi:hypothetical protein